MNKKKTLELKVQITGRVLISIERALKSLGQVGVNILREHGVLSLNQEKIYPLTSRTRIFDALLNRFGEAAVKALGFNMGSYWIKTFESAFIENLLVKNKKKKLNKNDHTCFKLANNSSITTNLENYMDCLADSWNVAIKSFIVSKDKSFKVYSKKIDSTNYKFYAKQPGLFSRHGIFNEINSLVQTFNHLVRDWDYSFVLNKKETKDYKYGCAFVYDVHFKKRKIKKNIYQFNSELKTNVLDSFLLNVLDFSESKRIETEKKKHEIENISSQLSKYIPPQIHDALFAGKYDTEIKTQRRKLTVFFSDIKNFTSTSENLQPEDLTKYLNEYFSEMTKIALNHGATIDKYIGDAMMVFFGDPETKGEREDARACVEMALRMQERMGELREKWLNEGFADPFEVRIGINTGYCNVGNFGSDQRLTYTIIGGEVNVAARLESAADANGILMSYETYAHAQDMVEVEQKEAIKMKGINREIKIYAVEGRKEVVKTKAKPTKAKKPTKKELTKIEQLEKELTLLKDRMRKLES